MLPRRQDSARSQDSDRDADTDNDEVPEVEAEDEFMKAMRLSKLEARKPRPRPEEDIFEREMCQAFELSQQQSHAPSREDPSDFDDEMRRALELSQQVSHRPQVGPDSDAEFERLLAESAREHAAFQQQRASSGEDPAMEAEILKESERLAAEHAMALKKRRKEEQEEYNKQLKQTKWENKQEWMVKEKQRIKHLQRQAQRDKEIAAEEAKARREADRLARLNASRGQRPDDDEATQALIRQIEAASLGDAPEAKVDDEVADVCPPIYVKLRGDTERRPNFLKYTTTSRDPIYAGTVCAITPAVTEEMREKLIEQAQLRNKEEEDPANPNPQYYKRSKDDPASKEGKAAGKKRAAPAPKQQIRPAWDMATALHGGTRQNVRNAVEAAAGPLPVAAAPTTRAAHPHPSPWMDRFNGVRRSGSRSAPRDRL